MPIYNSSDPKYGVKHIVPGTDAAKAASMTGTGPLLFPAEGWFAKYVLSDVPVSTVHTGGVKLGNLSTWIFVFEGGLKPDAELLGKNIPWWADLDRMSQFMGDLDATGLLKRQEVASLLADISGSGEISNTVSTSACI